LDELQRAIGILGFKEGTISLYIHFTQAGYKRGY